MGISWLETALLFAKWSDCCTIVSLLREQDEGLSIMLMIRLARTGAKKRPFYHVVATDSRNARDGRFNERLGYFNPVARGKELRLHLQMERIADRQSQGTQVSPRVAALIKEFNNPDNKKLEKKQQKKAQKVAAKQAEEKVAAEEAEKAEVSSSE